VLVRPLVEISPSRMELDMREGKRMRFEDKLSNLFGNILKNNKRKIGLRRLDGVERHRVCCKVSVLEKIISGTIPGRTDHIARTQSEGLLDRIPLLLVARLLREKDGVDVRENTTGRNRDVGEQLVELLVVSHSELDVTRDDARALVVARGVSGELENLSGEVLKHGREVHGGTRTDALGVSALAQVAVHSADGELKSRAEAAALRGAGRLLASLSLSFSSLARHDQRLTRVNFLGVVEEWARTPPRPQKRNRAEQRAAAASGSPCFFGRAGSGSHCFLARKKHSRSVFCAAKNQRDPERPRPKKQGDPETAAALFVSSCAGSWAPLAVSPLFNLQQKVYTSQLWKVCLPSVEHRSERAVARPSDPRIATAPTSTRS
jgi:hypothetical protein